MRGRLPLGPFDTCLRQPLYFECDTEGSRITGASLTGGLSRRNIEMGFEGLTPTEGLELAGRICARSSIAHSLAYCQAIELADGVDIAEGPAALRIVLAEYERIASHLEVVSDIGRALSDDSVHRGPRRYIERVRSVFRGASGSPFGMGMVVPGGVEAVAGDEPLRELSGVWKTLERDCAFWGWRLKLSRARLRGGKVPTGSFQEDSPPAPALRAAGLARDTRSGKTAYGYYTDYRYRPVVRDGGSTLDRALLLLEETRASVKVIRDVSPHASPGVPEGLSFGKGTGVGLCESPEGAVEHKVFLGAEGKIIRDRVTCAVSNIAGLAPAVLEGALYEDVAPAVISLYLCAPCLDL